MSDADQDRLYFSDVFWVSESQLDDYGAFDISLFTDLPLFVDPFLLFASEKPKYQALHDQMIGYLRFLLSKSMKGVSDRALIESWYVFSEVKQNWLGFCEAGNQGRGLGRDFANALNANLFNIFHNFGKEKITRGSHIEKLCLISPGVGRDMISDFTTNLTKNYLLEYTQQFALANIRKEYLATVSVPRVTFNYQVQRWMPATFTLPLFMNDFVILTPKDMLTKDDTWISHTDMIARFRTIPDAISNSQLRAQINEYFLEVLPRGKEPTKKDINYAIRRTITKYPELIDYYIKLKEDSEEAAVENSAAMVLESYLLYVQQFRALGRLLGSLTPFYRIDETTADETREKLRYFKDIIENKGGWKLFYIDGQPFRKESDAQIMFRLVWHRTPSDVSREVNDGRGPADFKISHGALDKTIVEFKLATNRQLKRNLERQAEIYKKASDAKTAFKAIIYFSKADLEKVRSILLDLDLEKDPNIFLIDARADNKPSASRA